MLVRVDHQNSWRIWTIDRPDRLNALGISVLEELERHLLALQQDLKGSHPPRGLTITAEAVDRGSKRIWVAGGDLSELAGLSQAEALNYAQRYQNFCQSLHELPLLVLAHISGEAIGGGVELALAAELRIGDPTTKFHFKQLELGLPTGYGGANRLTQLVGLAGAQKAVFLRLELAASQLMQWGLLSELADSPIAGRQRVKELQYDLGSLEPQAIAAQKKMFATHPNQTEPPGPSQPEAQIFANVWKNPTHAQWLHQWQQRQTKTAPSKE